MSSEPIWPPPPDVPHPLAEHDAFLSTLIRAPQTKLPMSRLSLTRELHRVAGKDLRQCLAVVNNYCDRHGIFPPRRGLRLWLVLLPSLFQFGLLGIMFVTQYIQAKNIAAASTQAARLLLIRNSEQWNYIFLASMIVCILFGLFRVVILRRQNHREAEKARAKML